MEGSMNRLHDLSKLLEQMGASAEEVEATLRATGVQGVRNTVRVLNPVVRYVQNALRLDNLDADVMTGKTLRVHGAGGGAVPLPKPVLDFLDAFNRGAYPDLELPPS
jgi:ABC-type uncharacterized transport system fused permease/ATPase subunit